jgi:hypothetical protein
MAIDSLIGLWSPFNCFLLSIIALFTIILGDAFAARFINVDPKFLGNSIDDPTKAHQVRTFFMQTNPTSSSLHALPNFWVWYEGHFIREALRNQVDSFVEFVMLTVYHATVCTSIVATACFFISMTLAIRAFHVFETFPRRYFTPLLAMFAFLMDFLEDLFLLIIATGFPGKTYPILEILCSYCSLFKWISWFVMLLWWFTMGFFILIRRTKRHDEE